MTSKWLVCALCAALLIGCGSSDRPDQIAGQNQPVTVAPATVRKALELTYTGSLQEIVDAYNYGDTQALQPRLIAEYEYDANDRMQYEKITSFREDVNDDASIIPAEGAVAFDMTYSYDPINPTELINFQQRNWGYWWYGDHGLLNSIANVNFIRDNGELVMLDTSYLYYTTDVETGLRNEGSSRTVSELINSDGRTVQIEIHSGIAPDAESPALNTPNFIDYFTYEGDLVVKRERIDIAGEIANFKRVDTYTYNSHGGLLSYTNEDSSDARPLRVTAYEHVIVDHEEYGRVYARVEATQAIDEFENVYPGDVKVMIYEVAPCELHNSDLIGDHTPQWAGCWPISAWGQ